MKPKVDDLAFPLLHVLELDQTCSRTPIHHPLKPIISHVRTTTTNVTRVNVYLNDYDLPVKIQGRARNRGGLVPNTS